MSEEAIRRYLTAIKDPTALIDHDAVNDLNARLESTDDPVARLKLRAEIERAKEPPIGSIERDFVEVAKSWADQHEVSTRAFLDEGVQPEVLHRAGFTVHKRQSRRQPRQPRTSADEAIRHVRSLRKPFTIKDVMEKAGTSRTTTQKAIATLLEEGAIVEAEPRKSGPGRPARTYQRA